MKDQSQRVWKTYFEIHWMVYDLELSPVNVWDIARSLWEVYGEPHVQPFTIWR